MLSTRLLSGMILLAAFLGVLWFDEELSPWYPFWFIFSMVAMGAAALELVGLLARTEARPSTNEAMGGVFALTVSNWVPHAVENLATNRPGQSVAYEPIGPIGMLAWPLLSFVGVLMVTFVIQGVRFSRPGRTMATISGTVLVVAYLGLLGSFVIQLRWMDGPYQGLLAVLFLIATAKGADTGAYLVGRLAGRRKLWPILSPNKTIEGAMGGMAVAVLASLAVNLLVGQFHDGSPFSVAGATGYGMLVGAAAQLGDLMESMIKRDCDQKDASSAVPGFGGVLDVLDSLLFAGPVAYGYWVCCAA